MCSYLFMHCLVDLKRKSIKKLRTSRIQKGTPSDNDDNEDEARESIVKMLRGEETRKEKMTLRHSISRRDD